MKTRERILQTARRLFNQHGYGNVSLAVLAKELGMAKGNLWYHFNDKRALLDALSAGFIELDQQRRKIKPTSGAVLDSYVAFLQALAGEIREYRFLFRDQADYGAHTELMEQQLPIIYSESVEQFKNFFTAMRDQGYLDLDESRFETLALNVILVLRYNLDFLRERQLFSIEDAGSVAQTFQQHLTLFEDKLSAQAAAYLNSAFSISDINRKAV